MNINFCGSCGAEIPDGRDLYGQCIADRKGKP